MMEYLSVLPKHSWDVTWVNLLVVIVKLVNGMLMGLSTFYQANVTIICIC